MDNHAASADSHDLPPATCATCADGSTSALPGSPAIAPQQARDAARAALALICALGTGALKTLSAALTATGALDVAQFLAVSKQITEAARELNRMDACEQRAAATALRRRQFESRQSRESRDQALRDLEAQHGMAGGNDPAAPQAHGDAGNAQGPDAADTQGRRVFVAATQYAPLVLEHIRHGKAGTLPDMPLELRQALVDGGMDPDNPSIRQGLINRMIESDLLPGVTSYPLTA